MSHTAQPCSESYEAVGDSPQSLLFVSCPNWGVNVNTLVFDLCPHAALRNDNGNLQSYTEYQEGAGYSQPLSFTQAMQYDGINRLTSVSEEAAGTQAATWSQSFSYDTFGNLWEATTGLPVVGTRPTSDVYDGNNRLTTASYSASGNQISLPGVSGASQSYDAENRITQVISSGTTHYLYDGEGRRVEKVSGAQTTVFVYDAAGELAASYQSGAGGGRAPCQTCYLATDHLGSTRLVMDEAGNVVARHDYTPIDVGDESGDRHNRVFL